MRYIVCLLLAVFSYLDAAKLSELENRRVQRKCGKYLGGDDDSKVLRGEMANFTDAPSVVLLSYYEGLTFKDYEDMIHCSGTLISPRHVLTAGHCIGVNTTNCPKKGVSSPSSYLKDIAGDWTAYLRINSIYVPEQGKLDENHLKVKVKQMFHPLGMDMGMCDGVDYGDIAIFELEEDVPYTEEITYACLAEKRIPKATEVKMFGYGIDPSVSGRFYGGALETYSTTITECFHRVQRHTVDEVCGRAPDNRMSCSGDSGGGFLHTRDDGKIEVVSILTGGPDCFNVNRFYKEGIVNATHDTMVDVFHHVPWICNATGVCPPSFDKITMDRLPMERTDFVTVNNLKKESMYEVVRRRKAVGADGVKPTPEMPDFLRNLLERKEKNEEKGNMTTE